MRRHQFHKILRVHDAIYGFFVTEEFAGDQPPAALPEVLPPTGVSVFPLETKIASATGRSEGSRPQRRRLFIALFLNAVV
jgi:hypothetical protein